MAFLERFRAQPRWKHADAAVRLDAVRELDATQQDVLSALAREDEDPRVRRTAVRKVQDADTLIAVAAADDDSAVREEAAGLLVDLALRTDDAHLGTRILAVLPDARMPLVAKSAALEGLRLAAIDRVDDPRALASVARQAPSSPARLAALARIGDVAELSAIAVKTEHKDVGLAAVDRLSDPAQLEVVATRARNRLVARRARMLLTADADAAQMEAARRSRRQELCDRIEALTAGDDAEALRARLDDALDEWRELGDDPEDDLSRRFADVRARARERLEAHETAIAERARLDREAARDRAQRGELCERMEALARHGADPEPRPDFWFTADEEQVNRAIAARDALVQTWESIPATVTPDEALARRFDEARASIDRALANRSRGREVREQLVLIADEAEGLGSVEDMRELSRRWADVRRRWAAAGGDSAAGPDLSARYSHAAALVGERFAAAREGRGVRQRENLTRLTSLAERLEAVADESASTLKDVDQALRELRDALQRLGPLPSREDEERIVNRLRAVKTRLSARLHELRQAVDWERWANANVLEELCGQMEALVEHPNLEEVATRLRDLQGRWRVVRGIPGERGDALRRRFAEALARVRARTDEYFGQQAAERAENLRRKESLCERAEALAESSDWIRTAETIKQLQAEWTAIGPVPRQHAKPTWDRFRAACDRFFTRRREDLSRRKTEWGENLRKKEALCERAEALADSTEWASAIAEIKRLQAEWKTIGPVRKNRSEALWGRFRGACDRFFERYGQRQAPEAAARTDEEHAIPQELEALVSDGVEPMAPDALREKVRSALDRWERAGTRRTADGDARFLRAFAALVERFPDAFRGTDLDPEAASARKQQLCERVEALLPATVDRSPVEVLAARWREALATNTIAGRVDDESRWRAATEDVRKAQAEWRRLPPVPGEAGRALAARFRQACDRFFAQRPKPSTGGAAAAGRR